MNRWQRGLLGVAAVALLAVVLTTPRVQYDRGAVLRAGRSSQLANVVDWRTAMLRGGSVLGATALPWFAVGDARKE